ncbi:MAG: LdpA C-terminal domain-containing domain [Candidatus Sericytochromatia bacterium]|nr:LdpA C-terminal domain-containing domain [Candidatus Sericytochromatia bacterium]
MSERFAHRLQRGVPYFKFIGGANLRDLLVVERLATLYALAGATLIDVAAEPAVVAAARRGILTARRWHEQRLPWLVALAQTGPQDFFEPLVMASITLEGDRHTQIAVVDDPLCVTCDRCTPVCPPGSIVNGTVKDIICTGCGLCVPVCPTACISLQPRDTMPDLEACRDAGAEALEIHTGVASEPELREMAGVARDWQRRGGLLSYSLDGHQLGYPRIKALTRELGKVGVIIQADGKPISGTQGLRSTIPAVRLARTLSALGTGAWIQPAGGTNDQTGPLSRRLNLSIAGVGMGSFARRVARELEAGADSPAVWARALDEARQLVKTVHDAGSLTGPAYSVSGRYDRGGVASGG